MVNILTFDIETAPNEIYAWGIWEQNALRVIKEGYMLCYAYKWNDGKTKVVSLPDFAGYKKDKKNDKALVKSLWELFNEADIVIAHNGDQFDIKYTNGRFLKHGMLPPQRYQTIDTLKIARSHFKLNSNKLDEIGNLLGVGRKVSHEGFGLWEKCMAGDVHAWNRMKKYNKQDVNLLYNVYIILRAWHKSHPNIALIAGETRPACVACTSTSVQKRGKEYKGNAVYQRWRCKDCGKNMYASFKTGSPLKST